MMRGEWERGCLARSLAQAIEEHLGQTSIAAHKYRDIYAVASTFFSKGLVMRQTELNLGAEDRKLVEPKFLG
jgi:hypothetical protein